MTVDALVIAVLALFTVLVRSDRAAWAAMTAGLVAAFAGSSAYFAYYQRLDAVPSSPGRTQGGCSSTSPHASDAPAAPAYGHARSTRLPGRSADVLPWTSPAIQAGVHGIPPRRTMNHLRRLQAERPVVFWVLVVLGLLIGFQVVIAVVSLLLGPLGLPSWAPVVVVVGGLVLIARHQQRSR
ncbi:MAG: hypothetical protein ACLGI3_10240 [Actinomycetes bacterium]